MYFRQGYVHLSDVPQMKTGDLEMVEFKLCECGRKWVHGFIDSDLRGKFPISIPSKRVGMLLVEQGVAVGEISPEERDHLEEQLNGADMPDTIGDDTAFITREVARINEIRLLLGGLAPIPVCTDPHRQN